MPDTSGAREDLRVARQYIEKFKQDDQMADLGHAERYIRLAREKDPNATLLYKKVKQVITATPDHLEAEVHFLIGTDSIYEETVTKTIATHGVNELRKAIELNPSNPAYYKALSDAYMRLDDKKEALAVLQESRERFPNNFYTRSALDDLSRPEPPPEPKKPNPFAISLLLGFAFLAIAILTSYYQLFHPPLPRDSPAQFFLSIGNMTWLAAIVSFIIAYVIRPQSIRDYQNQLDR